MSKSDEQGKGASEVDGSVAGANPAPSAAGDKPAAANSDEADDRPPDSSHLYSLDVLAAAMPMNLPSSAEEPAPSSGHIDLAKLARMQPPAGGSVGILDAVPILGEPEPEPTAQVAVKRRRSAPMVIGVSVVACGAIVAAILYTQRAPSPQAAVSASAQPSAVAFASAQVAAFSSAVASAASSVASSVSSHPAQAPGRRVSTTRSTASASKEPAPVPQGENTAEAPPPPPPPTARPNPCGCSKDDLKCNMQCAIK